MNSEQVSLSFLRKVSDSAVLSKKKKVTHTLSSNSKNVVIGDNVSAYKEIHQII